MAFYYRQKSKIYYQFSKGKKPCIVFLHGWNENTSMWKSQIKYFRKLGYSTLSFDFRGFGKSDKLADHIVFELSDFAYDFLCLLKHLKIENFIIFARSMGGMVANIFINKYNLSPKGAVYLATSFAPGDELLWRNSANLAVTFASIISKKFRKIKPAKYDLSIYYKNTAADLYNFLYNGFSYSTTYSELASAKAILRFNALLHEQKKIPSLILHGLKDLTFNKRHALKISKKLHWAKLVWIREGTHFFNNQYQSKVNSILYSFIKSI